MNPQSKKKGQEDGAVSYSTHKAKVEVSLFPTWNHF
jgi:hypothetical protein